MEKEGSRVFNLVAVIGAKGRDDFDFEFGLKITGRVRVGISFIWAPGKAGYWPISQLAHLG